MAVLAVRVGLKIPHHSLGYEFESHYPYHFLRGRYSMIKEFLAANEFFPHCRGDTTDWYSRSDRMFIEVDNLNEVFKIYFTIPPCINVEYTTLSTKFLVKDSKVLELAFTRMERLLDSRVVKNITKDYLDGVSRIC